jgi:hypothetical protein
MQRKALYRIHRPGGPPRWIHRSQRKSKVILRSLYQTADDAPPAWKVLGEYRLPDQQDQLTAALDNGQEFSLSEIATRTVSAVDVSADELSLEQVTAWQRIFDRLNEPGVLDPAIEPASGRTIANATTAPSPLIPQTRLRRFYQTLRDLNTSGMHKSIVDFFIDKGADRTKKLDVLFEESVGHFRRYENSKDEFHPQRKESWCVKYANSPHDFARCLAARLCTAGWQVVGGNPPTEIEYVDYEISPFRTTDHASFEDNNVGTSGCGGLSSHLSTKSSSSLMMTAFSVLACSQMIGSSAACRPMSNAGVASWPRLETQRASAGGS